MSHETHHHHHEPATEVTKTPFRSAFFFVLILAGLFIAGVNFVKVMSHGAEEGHDGGHGTEATHPATGGGGTHGHETGTAEHHGTQAGAPASAEDSALHHETEPAVEAGHTEGH